MHVAALPAFANRSANRYNTLLYSALQRLGVTVEEWTPSLRGARGVDIVHVHWPESPLNKVRPSRAAGRSVQLLAGLAVAKLRGAKVVWTAHNAAAHWQRYPRAERWFWRVLDRLLDGWIALSPASLDAVVSTHPRLATVPRAVIAHGHYKGAYADDITRADARAQLELPSDAQVVAFVGRVKPYKGVDTLLETFAALPGDSVRLLVAGRCDDATLGERLAALSAADSRVVLHLEAIADDALQVWLRAADVVVLPYVAVLNSGSALLALSFEVPVLVPERGGLADLAAAVPGWVRTYDGDLRPHDLLAALAARPSGVPDLSRFGWEQIAEQTLAFYSSL